MFQMLGAQCKDEFIFRQALQNALLMDALIKSASSPDLCHHSSDLNTAIHILAFFSKEEAKKKFLIEDAATKGVSQGFPSSQCTPCLTRCYVYTKVSFFKLKAS